MKKLFFTLPLLLLSVDSFAECHLVQRLNGQKHFSCTFEHTQHPLQVLELTGSYEETAYYHGYFLKDQIERGAIKGVQTKSEAAFSSMSREDQKLAKSIQSCVIDRYRQSVSPEFKTGIEKLHKGMKAAGSTVPYEVVDNANYMVEFSIFVDALAKNPWMKTTAALGCIDYIAFPKASSALSKFAEDLRKIKMGCTGISAPGNVTNDGKLVHGRNFDTGLLGYFEPNQVVLIQHLPNRNTVVSLSSAGIHYGGGVSGFNSHGLSISLHELQTTNVRTLYFPGSSDTGPFLSHRILMEAKNINDAVKLIKSSKGFGAWTFLVSDAKTNEIASIELSGDVVKVARHHQSIPMGQSNHFISDENARYGFQYSPNKTLESKARLDFVTRRLKEDTGQINSQWVINHLSSHYDEFIKTRRSFGKTTTKVYTAASHILLPGNQEFWMSLGDHYPTNRNPFLGFKYLGNKGNTNDFPLEFLGMQNAQEDQSYGNWYDSMSDFVQAFLVFEHNERTMDKLDLILSKLQSASDKALLDQVYEYPYHFMWARIQIEKGRQLQKMGHHFQAGISFALARSKLEEIKQRNQSGNLALGANELTQINHWQEALERKVLPESEVHFATVE